MGIMVQALCRSHLQEVVPARLRMHRRQPASGRAPCGQAAQTAMSSADLFHAGIKPKCRVHLAPLALSPRAGWDVSGSALHAAGCGRVGEVLRLLPLERRQSCPCQALSVRRGLLSAAASLSLHDPSAHVHRILPFLSH
jgi:hypothetical protein